MLRYFYIKIKSFYINFLSLENHKDVIINLFGVDLQGIENVKVQRKNTNLKLKL